MSTILDSLIEISTPIGLLTPKTPKYIFPQQQYYKIVICSFFTGIENVVTLAMSNEEKD